MRDDQRLDRLVNLETAAHLLGLRPVTVRKMTRRGDIAVVRPTGKRAIRYRIADLEALVQLRSVPMRSSQ